MPNGFNIKKGKQTINVEITKNCKYILRAYLYSVLQKVLYK